MTPSARSWSPLHSAARNRPSAVKTIWPTGCAPYGAGRLSPASFQALLTTSRHIPVSDYILQVYSLWFTGWGHAPPQPWSQQEVRYTERECPLTGEERTYVGVYLIALSGHSSTSPSPNFKIKTARYSFVHRRKKHHADLVV